MDIPGSLVVPMDIPESLVVPVLALESWEDLVKAVLHPLKEVNKASWVSES